MNILDMFQPSLGLPQLHKITAIGMQRDIPHSRTFDSRLRLSYQFENEDVWLIPPRIKHEVQSSIHYLPVWKQIGAEKKMSSGLARPAGRYATTKNAKQRIKTGVGDSVLLN